MLVTSSRRASTDPIISRAFKAVRPATGNVAAGIGDAIRKLCEHLDVDRRKLGPAALCCQADDARASLRTGAVRGCLLDSPATSHPVSSPSFIWASRLVSPRLSENACTRTIAWSGAADGSGTSRNSTSRACERPTENSA